ncbi:MAG: hypothetical protein FJX74_06365 [Armatimonadetes bacterium]|nr:hypothetical protein [Armatimonadota bacterium]
MPVAPSTQWWWRLRRTPNTTWRQTRSPPCRSRGSRWCPTRQSTCTSSSPALSCPAGAAAGPRTGRSLQWRAAGGVPGSIRLPQPFDVLEAQNHDGSPGYDCPTQPDDGPPPEDPLDLTKEGQDRFFTHLIARSLLAVHLYGFGRIVLLPGHGPNPEYCRRAEGVYRENVLRRSAFGEPAETLTFFYIEAAREAEPLLKNHWVHADKWEGSLTMAAAPGTVRPELLPVDPHTIPPAYLGHPYLTETEGYNPALQHLWPSFDALDPRHDTNEAYGRAQWEAVLVGLEAALVR